MARAHMDMCSDPALCSAWLSTALASTSLHGQFPFSQEETQSRTHFVHFCFLGPSVGVGSICMTCCIISVWLMRKSVICWGWGGGSLVRSTGWFSWELGFSPHHPLGSSLCSKGWLSFWFLCFHSASAGIKRPIPSPPPVYLVLEDESGTTCMLSKYSNNWVSYLQPPWTWSSAILP